MGDYRLTAICGRIGSGKSVVSRILSALGYAVYDCDSRAKKLMDSSRGIMEAIAGRISPEAIVRNEVGEMRICRPRLSEIVFSDRSKLLELNSIVHSAVREDIARWCEMQSSERGEGGVRLFVETAILVESELHRMVEDVWEVEAPEVVRLCRAMARDNADESRIRARMKNQQPLPEPLIHTDSGEVIPVVKIRNYGDYPLLPQILDALGK